MNRRSFFQTAAALLLAPNPPEQVTLPQIIGQWPEGMGDANYDFMSPLLLTYSTKQLELAWNLPAYQTPCPPNSG